MKPVEKKLSFNKGGNGGYTVKLGLPIDFVNALNLTKEDNKVMLTLEDGVIMIRKKENE